MKTIILAARAAKELDALPAQARRAVEKALNSYAVAGVGDVLRLQGSEGFRIRVGEYRVLFSEVNGSILVVYVGRRSTTPTKEAKMADVQIIRTAAGEELVVLPRADYDALVGAVSEDAEDAALFAERMAEITLGGATLSPEVSAEMLRGSSLLAALRKTRGMTQLHLAKSTGLSQGYLSDIESGRRTGAVEALRKIANALEVPVSLLVATS